MWECFGALFRSPISRSVQSGEVAVEKANTATVDTNWQLANDAAIARVLSELDYSELLPTAPPLDQPAQPYHDTSATHPRPECCICFDDGAQLVSISQYCHSHVYCKPCCVLTIAAFTNFPARCHYCAQEEKDGEPQSDDTPTGYICADSMAVLQREGVVDGAVAARFNRAQLMAVVGHHQLTQCPDCKVEAVRASDNTQVICYVCDQLYCQDCNVLWTADHDCREVAAQRAGTDTATAEQLRQSSKPCPRCRTPITHYFQHGCHHIKPGGGCQGRLQSGQVCGAHFCYVCLRMRDSSDGGCDCSASCPNDRSCGCPVCPDCAAGRKCTLGR